MSNKLIKIELTQEQLSILKNVFEDAKFNALNLCAFDEHKDYCSLYFDIFMQVAGQREIDPFETIKPILENKVKCTCECHTDSSIKHRIPCCHNGYINSPIIRKSKV